MTEHYYWVRKDIISVQYSLRTEHTMAVFVQPGEEVGWESHSLGSSAINMTARHSGLTLFRGLYWVMEGGAFVH
jgi:hypothetical protein